MQEKKVQRKTGEVFKLLVLYILIWFGVADLLL